jgi:hypothetical protein
LARDRLRTVVEQRLREELATLQVEVNEEKSRRVDLTQGERFGFLGSEFRRIRSRRDRWMPLHTPCGKADGAPAHAQADFPQSSVPANQRGDCENQPVAWLGVVVCRRPFEPVLLVHSRLGRKEDSAPFGAGQPASRFRLEAVE